MLFTVPSGKLASAHPKPHGSRLLRSDEENIPLNAREFYEKSKKMHTEPGKTQEYATSVSLKMSKSKNRFFLEELSKMQGPTPLTTPLTNSPNSRNFLVLLEKEH
jgi:hypothetical protein